MKKTLYSSAFALTLLLSSCGLIQHTSQGGNDGLQKEATAEVAPAVAEEPVAPNDQLLNVEELVSVFTDAAHMDAAMKKYGYKVQNAYEVFRVAKYDKMYYKNCRLPKKSSMVSLRTIPVRSVTVFPAMWRWEMAR